ncbi:hypothetical protein [Caenispirillum bisanense]|uniref:Uncharacterized protein n=1 Tax=Caenispirillum bisanense TaxID=414052 RepID=A0A286GYM5_9PROT|nr:hypothetical protein [Caenispirillum bisanense]SOE00623.1 hypothetical protein SAMN05421508_11368 [Caenispirillum bisanense]
MTLRHLLLGRLLTVLRPPPAPLPHAERLALSGAASDPRAKTITPTT